VAGVSVAAGLSAAATLQHVTAGDGECRTQRVGLPGGTVTWTVLGPEYRVVGPVEEFLEYLRVQGTSPNTVKSYARALALWWTYLSVFGLAWDALALAEVGGFLAWLRSGDGPQVVSIRPRPARFAESTISTRLRAVTSCYRFHELNGVALGGDLARVVHGGRAVYQPMLEHVARTKGRRRAAIRVQAPRHVPPPVLSPGQIEAICDACARFEPVSGRWTGRVRDRLLWSLLAEAGLRLGEALGLQHRDWHTGRGDTPFIEVVPREHPHGVRVKGGNYRRVFISDELDRLYGEYLWQLCDAGADLAVADLDAAPVFVNLAGGTRFAPWRPESVYDLVGRLRRDLARQVPAAWSPHWMRHSHATALLMAGVPVHVVSRRLGHADVQTTLELYAHVTEDADMRSVAEWRTFTAGWRAAAGGQDGPGS
jgi:site-specific recombinase XerD